MTFISLPGARLGNNEHAPDLPGMGRFFAVPQMASFSYTLRKSVSKTLKDMNIAPAIVIPLDTDDSLPIYEKDPIIYSTNAFYPTSPVKISEPRIIRGVDAGIINITPFQYNPVTKDLVVYTNIEVEVKFSGGNGHVGEDRLRSPYFDPILKTHFINADIPLEKSREQRISRIELYSLNIECR